MIAVLDGRVIATTTKAQRRAGGARWDAEQRANVALTALARSADPAHQRAMLEVLYATFGQRLWKLAVKKLHDEDAAHEVVQDTFVRVLRAMQGGRIVDGTAWQPYVFRIAERLCLDRLRPRALVMLPIDEFFPGGDTVVPKDPEGQTHTGWRRCGHEKYFDRIVERDAAANPEALVTHAADSAEIAAVLARLPARWQWALLGKYRDGRTYDELAAEEGTNRTTVKAAIFRGRSRFRTLYAAQLAARRARYALPAADLDTLTPAAA